MSNSTLKRIFLSPPHMGGEEMSFVKEAFESNYIAPLGPQVDAFEREFAEYVGIKNCLALSSGTAAMHLALRILGVGLAPEEWPPDSTGQVRLKGKDAQSSKLKAESKGGTTYRARKVGGEVAEDLFERGLCLPSGTAMTDSDLDRVIDTILNCRKKAQKAQR